MRPGETLFLHPRSVNRPPNGIRTRVPAVKERCPRPLDDRGVFVYAERRRVELLRPVKGSLFSKQVPPPSLGWPFHGGACLGRDSNSHARRGHQYLRLARMPFRHRGVDAPNVPGCAEGGEHDSQRVTPSIHLANGPGAPVRFTLREGRRGCVSPAQLPHQYSDLDYLIQNQRCYRLHHEASCSRDAGRSRTGIARRHRFADGWLTVHPQRHGVRAPGRSRTDDLPFTRGALCTN